MIDERVFRSIRQAQAVVVDLTVIDGDGDRINVGLEARYAMALGKPIVAIRRAPLEPDPKWVKDLPFDIVTLNTFPYGPEPTEENIRILADKLTARVGLAIGK